MASLRPPDLRPPLAGVNELDPLHVISMLRRSFYGQPWMRDYESRTRRYAAVVAMHALAGAGPIELDRFEADHFDAEGRSVLLTFLDVSRYVYVGPVLLHVLMEWVEIRKYLVRANGGCKAMFVGEKGIRLKFGTNWAGLRTIGERLGAPRSLSTMLLDFFRATIARSSDAEAYRYLLGTFPNHVRNSSATLRDIRDLIVVTDRIGDDLSFLTDEARAAEIARASGLPLCLDELLAPKTDRSLDPAHPLAVRLAAELKARPADPEACAAHDRRVIAENLAEMEPLIRSVELSEAAASRMLGMTTSEFLALKSTVVEDDGLVLRSASRNDLLPMKAEERSRIAGILAEAWPDDPELQPGFRIDLVRCHAPFVHALIAGRKLYKRDARRLFKATHSQVNAIKRAGDEGRLEALLADLSGAVWSVSSTQQIPMTEAQKTRLARIRAERWPEDPYDQTDFRIDLLRREFGFVRGLILQRHLNRRAPRDLFKLTFGQTRALMDAGAGAKLERILKDPTGRLWVGGTWSLDREHRARVERLADTQWPSDPAEWPAFRMRLLRREHPFVWSLVLTGRLTQESLRPLFRLTREQASALIDASVHGRLWRLLTNDAWQPLWAVRNETKSFGTFAWPLKRRGRRRDASPSSSRAA